MVVTASRSTTLYEGTTGLAINCEVTPDDTGVNTLVSINRAVNGPGADGSRANTTFPEPNSITVAITPLALVDAGLYTCTASVGATDNSEYIVTSNPTTGMFTLSVDGKISHVTV